MTLTRTTRSIALAIIAMSSVPAFAQNEVVANSTLDFIPLNPARGDAAPQAGVLWGDIRMNTASGVLLKFADGFTSPPHIHNITYRAVVISGAIHNDDPGAEKLWMEPGSFWTQPAGENHITAGRPGSGSTAFLEIMEGPYLVQPSKESFDNGERPLNLNASNIVWLNATDVTWVGGAAASSEADMPKMAFLWGDADAGERNGSFVKLATGSTATIKGGDVWMRAVVIEGRINHQDLDKDEETALDTGSYFGSNDGSAHEISCESDAGCILYVSTQGKYDVVATKSGD